MSMIALGHTIPGVNDKKGAMCVKEKEKEKELAQQRDKVSARNSGGKVVKIFTQFVFRQASAS